MNKKLITFVCTGNTCRSIMAEYIFKKLIKENNRKDIDVYSCGISPSLPFLPQHTLKVLKEYNISNISGYPKPVNKNIIDKSFLILTMTQYHKDILLTHFNKYKDKIFTLKEYIGSEGDIFDPFTLGIKEYKECAKEIEQCLKILITKI